MRGLILLLAALLGGCAAPIGSDGLPITLERAPCAVPAPLYCTRSLGVPDCWSAQSKPPNSAPALADTPVAAPGCG